MSNIHGQTCTGASKALSPQQAIEVVVREALSMATRDELPKAQQDECIAVITAKINHFIRNKFTPHTMSPNDSERQIAFQIYGSICGS